MKLIFKENKARYEKEESKLNLIIEAIKLDSKKFQINEKIQSQSNLF
ncbi:hypothetical protein SRH_03745 [Mesomycoplasma hyorhinis MCLD]|nr:hypothetical protein SRH_03745 [Mesomycoplasma hyorhinis MCLD]